MQQEISVTNRFKPLSHKCVQSVKSIKHQNFRTKTIAFINFKRTFAYLDDILVVSETEEQHIQDLHYLAKRLSEKGLLIAANKCKFGVDQLTFLGFHVTTSGITPLPERVKAIREYPAPQTVKQL